MASALSKIRNNIGLVVVFVGVAIASFVLIDLFRGTGGGPVEQHYAEIHGEGMPYSDYQAQLDYVRRVFPPDPSLSEDMKEAQSSDQAYNQAVNQYVFEREFNSIGLNVTDKDLNYMYHGSAVSPPNRNVVNFFLFRDSTGRFSPNMVSQQLAVAQQIAEGKHEAAGTPQGQEFLQLMTDLDRALMLSRYDEKYNALIAKAALVSDNEAKRQMMWDNTTASVDYLFVPYATIPDQQVQVTEADLKAYYDAHKEQFRGEDVATINVAYFPLVPSADDSAKFRENFAKVSDALRRSDNPLATAQTQTDEGRVDTRPMVLDSVPAFLRSVARMGRTDTVVGPLTEGNDFVIGRVGEVIADSASWKAAYHILVPIQGDSAKAKARAEQLVQNLNGENFQDSARVVSKDPQTRINGGSLGYIREGNINPQMQPFASDFDSSKVGDIFVTSSPQGYHVVYISDATDTLYTSAVIRRSITAGSDTRKLLRKQVNDFGNEARTAGDLEKAREKFPQARVQNGLVINPGSYNLAGMAGSRNVVVWSMNAKSGEISDKVLETAGGMAIVQVVSREEKGIHSFESVRQQVLQEVLREKKAAAIKAKLTGGDLAAMAAQYGPGAKTGTIQSLLYRPNSAPELNNEPKVIGVAFGLQEGQTSQPLAGDFGVYVIRTNKINRMQEPNPAMLQGQKMTMRAAYQQELLQRVTGALREIANVRDLRYQVEGN